MRCQICNHSDTHENDYDVVGEFYNNSRVSLDIATGRYICGMCLDICSDALAGYGWEEEENE